MLAWPPAGTSSRTWAAALVPSPAGLTVSVAVQDVVGDAVLRERRRGLGAPEARCVRLVLAEQQLGARLGMEVDGPELGVIGAHDGVRPVDPDEVRLWLIGRPRPRVAEPQRRQHVERGIDRRPVVHRDPTHDVLRAGLGVLHLDVEVVAVVEDAGVDELVLHLLAGSGPGWWRRGRRTGTRRAGTCTASAGSCGSAGCRRRSSTPSRPRRGCPRRWSGRTGAPSGWGRARSTGPVPGTGAACRR